ncbi:2-nitropropane dioxygenase [Mycobacterium interjectum]|nr:2-nitropropane dioxygenase [Mycobacterium interjectum]
MLSTPWSSSFGLRVPILNAPMGGVAGGRLAAAVTAAGGLGMVGMGSNGSRELLRAQLRHVRGRFGIGLVDWVMRNEQGLLEDALAAAPALLSVSFGTDWSWVSHAHDTGIPTVTQVYDAMGARRAVDAGVDVLVARGAEGGGHGEVKLGTLPLLDAVLDTVNGAAPVLAGGGIASPRSLAAVLAAGASGAWVGTRLAACPEALTGDGSRRALIAAQATDTAVTRAFDVAKGLPWPARFPARVLANDFVARWTGHEDALDPPACDELSAAIAADDRRVAPVDAGEGVGMIRDDASVGEVIEQMCTGAERLLTAWGRRP